MQQTSTKTTAGKDISVPDPCTVHQVQGWLDELLSFHTDLQNWAVTQWLKLRQKSKILASSAAEARGTANKFKLIKLRNLIWKTLNWSHACRKCCEINTDWVCQEEPCSQEPLSSTAPAALWFPRRSRSVVGSLGCQQELYGILHVLIRPCSA